MDTDTVLNCCLAVPSRHSCPGFPGRSQPRHHTSVSGASYRSRSLDRIAVRSSGPRGIPGEKPDSSQGPHLALIGTHPHPDRSLCHDPHGCSDPCRLAPCPGSGALCSRPDHRVAGTNGGAGGGPNVLRFAASRSPGRERIFGSPLNQKRTYPVLRGSRFSLSARRTFVLSRQPLAGKISRQFYRSVFWHVFVICLLSFSLLAPFYPGKKSYCPRFGFREIHATLFH